MESGRLRNRRLHASPIEMMEVAWNFTEDQFDIFKTFFDVGLENGTLEFDLAGIGTVAFWESTYSQNHTDNLFYVSAKLELTVPYSAVPALPDITVIYEDELDSDGLPITSNCRSYFSLKWEFAFYDGPGIIQTAKSENGPWFDYITPNATPEDLATKTIKVDINNQFNATRYFRIVQRVTVGSEVTTTVITKNALPLASVVPLPDWAITGLDTERTLPVISETYQIYQPYSYQENGLISDTRIYVEPLARLEWRSDTSPGTQIISVSNVPDGGTWKWAVNGADPTSTTKIPIYNGITNNLACPRDTFAMVVKIRCFSGGCKSPLAVIAIDKRHVLQSLIIPVASTGPGTFVAGVCDLPKGDVLSGYDCSIYGGSGGLMDLTIDAACGNSTPSLSSGHDILVYKTSTFTAGPDTFGFNSFHCVATRFRADTIQAIARYPRWDDVPSVCEYLEQSTNLSLAPHFELLTTPVLGGGLAGSGGSFALSHSATNAYIYSVVAGYGCSGTEDVHITYAQWDYLFSVINEEGDPILTVPVEPMVDSPVYGDDFEEYDDSADATSLSLAAGTGFVGAWIVSSALILDGFDTWIDTGDPDDDYTGGYGWVGSWTITGGPNACYDYFEDYIDANPAPNAENLHGGEGWSLNSDGYQHGWIFTPDVSGQDDFQSYVDSSYVNTTALGGGTGWTLSDWVINDVDYKDDFQSYVDSSDVIATTLNGGTGWASQWALHEQNYQDNFQSYSDDSDVTTADAMNGGTGWTGQWTIN